jgi:hypothetical protein
MVETPSQLVEVTPLNWWSPLSIGGAPSQLVEALPMTSCHHVIRYPLEQEIEVLVRIRERFQIQDPSEV